MSLTASEISQLKKLVEIAQKLIDSASETKPAAGPAPSRRNGGSTRSRRSGKELAAFRKMLKAERKSGTPVSAIAKKHGVSTAYIYQLG